MLVHGLGLSSRYLVPLGRRLGALGYRVLAPDLPGFGKTKPPAGTPWAFAPTVHEQAEQLLAWMDSAGVDRAVLFGNSVGTQVAVEVAVRQPQRVERPRGAAWLQAAPLASQGGGLSCALQLRRPLLLIL